MPDRVTLQQVAVECRLSISTVSRALQRHPRIPEITRLRVIETANRLGWRPDPALSALVAHRQALRAKGAAPKGEVIAFLTRWKMPTLWAKRSPYLAEYFSAAQARADELGYKLENFWLHPSQLTRKRGTEILRARGVRGIVLPVTNRPFSHLNLDWDEFTVVAFRRALAYPRHHFLSTDHFFDMRLLMRCTRKLGYKRPGLLLSQVSNRYSGGCLEAAFFHELRHSYPNSNHVSPLMIEGGDACAALAVRRWFRKHRPDVIIGSTHHSLDLLVKAGIRVPVQAGFVAFHILSPSEGIAGLDHRARDAGRMTVDFLHQLILRGERGVPELPEGLLVACRWHDGQTLPKFA
jgi:LacI family transcriptional regulator